MATDRPREEGPAPAGTLLALEDLERLYDGPIPPAVLRRWREERRRGLVANPGGERSA